MLLRLPRNTRRRRIILLVQILVFAGLYLGARSWVQREMVSGTAPDINSHLVAGDTVSLRDYHGKPLLLHFWAEWCRICKLEQGAITSVAKHWPVLTVAMQSGDRLAVEDYLKARQLDWSTIVDETGALAKRYGVAAVPATFILDGNGEIRFHEMGYTTSWGLRIRLWLAKLASK